MKIHIIFIIIVIGTILVSGCIGQSDGTIKVSIDPIPSYVDTSYENVITDSFSYWQAGENITFIEADRSVRDVVLISWVKEFGGETAGHVVRGNFVQIGLGDSLCFGNWQPYKYDVVKRIAIHEFGHVIGKDHTDNPNDVMYPTIPTKYSQDFKESEFLPRGAIRFYPLCTRSNSTATYTFEVNSTEEISIYIVPSKEDFDKLSNGKDFNYYPDCSNKDTREEKTTCTISSKGGLILQNPPSSKRDAQFTATAIEE